MRQVIGQIRQHLGTDLPSCLSVNTCRTSARVLPNTFGCCRKYPNMADQSVQPTEPLRWMGSSEFREMFKFAEWVAHEVYHLCTPSRLNDVTCDNVFLRGGSLSSPTF